MTLQNPALWWAGLALIAAPIMIHLLNRRRVRVVDWAAMEFLLEANQRNRRRVLIENLLLLLLRCLAVGLLALVVGRPLLSSSLAGKLAESAPLERVVVLDDSMSMQAALGASSSFEVARDRLVELCRNWAGETHASVLTLRVTSRPDEPVVQGARLSIERLEEVLDALRRLEPTDLATTPAAALSAVVRDLESAPATPRQLHLLTDLRRRDWRGEEAGGRASSKTPLTDSAPAGDLAIPAGEESSETAGRETSESAAELLAQLAQKLRGATVVDVGADEADNLVVAAIEAEGILAVDVPSRLSVQVWNAGPREARDLEVRFTAGESVPLVEKIERLGAGERATTAFTVTFPGSLLGDERREMSIPVRAEVTSGELTSVDRVAVDSVRVLAPKARRGIPVLIVDGDPSAEYGKSESFYLERALAPPGRVPSGIVPEVVSGGELDSQSLDAYQVICLCNVGSVDDERREALEAWVRAGGGLALFPGDEVREAEFNACWQRGGRGLSPVELTGIQGDESERTSVAFRLEGTPVGFLSIFAGDDNPLLPRVKIFRWWGARLTEGADGGRVLARWTDAAGSLALAERVVGAGRVVWFAGPADADWSNWTADPSYVVAMQELVRGLARRDDASEALRAGQPWRVPIDLGEYRPEAVLRSPRAEGLPVQATPRGAESAATSAGRAIWEFEFTDTRRQGFYELTLAKAEEGTERVLQAVSLEPDEGDLTRADQEALRRLWGDAPITIVKVEGALTAAGTGGESELWWYVAWGLAGLLGFEPWLAWRFGRNRT